MLVLGVATDLATLHRTLSFSDTSRMNLQVLQSPTSTHYLNKVHISRKTMFRFYFIFFYQILEDIILTPTCSITLSGKVFNLLTEIFLYYDLSINSFMQAFKVGVFSYALYLISYSLIFFQHSTAYWNTIIKGMPILCAALRTTQHLSPVS